MKSSTLHRSGLSKERMAMFEDNKPRNLDKNEIPQYGEAQQGMKELDVLYKHVERNFKTPATKKTPGVYFFVGLLTGVFFMLVVMGIVALSSATPKESEIEEVKAPQAQVLPSENTESITGEEKYTIKQGDTIDKIVYRFYGKYDTAKIQQILDMNNIKNPSRLQVGQVIVVPVTSR